MKPFLLQIIFLFFLTAVLPAQSGVFQWQGEAASAAPCHDPAVLIGIKQQGYCGDADRPAIVVQCTNCEEVNWNFAVEVRAPGEDWRPLRPDGLPQIASGNAQRIEPMCVLAPDSYYVRVQAWGLTCPSKVTRLLGEPVAITATGSKTFAYAGKAPEGAASMPESCKVAGQAVLTGTTIRGWLRLDAASPCRGLNPYATVTYSNPAYRDLPISDLPLQAGVEVPFQFELDARDLARSQHPIEVLVYSGMGIAAQQVPLASYWLHAEPEQVASAVTPRATPPVQAFPALATGEEAPAEPMLQETFDTIGVTASDPNCNGIQDIKIVYHPVSPDEPNYISWLSPRCCQEEGCAYAVWVGSDPDRVRLLVKGTKPGAVIREVLPGLLPGDDYFEVVMETSNGVRKAAFVTDEGPIYGLEEVIAYRDRWNQDMPKSDSLVFVKSPGAMLPQEPATKEVTPYQPPGQATHYEASTNSWMGAEDPSIPTIRSGPSPSMPALVEVTQLREPLIPVSTFSPCRYDRDVTMTGDQQIRRGERVTIKYDHSREGYLYTLYFRPETSNEWVIAPGTQELQEKPEFHLNAQPYHSGSYLILTYKPSKKWGCLSSTLEAPVKLSVTN